ncbi:MAG: hypothetical protein IJZ79_03790 [Bacilli bacterium]|nr:hypothetical protein [Bacilli bacterium]MBQ8218852.1 hypothetical protein [Bacilli bacterium]
MGVRVNSRDDWFEIWFEDKTSILNTMVSNMQADLNAGYDYFGTSITRQRQIIDMYKQQFDAELDSFKSMDDKQINRWCFYDMKKRGVIE